MIWTDLDTDEGCGIEGGESRAAALRAAAAASQGMRALHWYVML
jgi:hypothetical protein